MTKSNYVKLPVVHPNAGVAKQFQRQLDKLIDEMNRSLIYWLSAAYRANTPNTVAQDGAIVAQLVHESGAIGGFMAGLDSHNGAINTQLSDKSGKLDSTFATEPCSGKQLAPRMATDASSASILNAIMARLTRRWMKRFNEAAKPMADYYAQAAKDRTDASLKAALKKAGLTVEFKVTPEIQDIITASVNNNVQSIKSIASEHLTDVAQIVQRSVQEGRNLGGLQEELIKRYGITKRRASLIAGTSNNQASAMIERQRAKELDITEAQWVHSNAGKHPRHEHVDWHGKMYNIHEGMWSEVSHKYVWPGTDFNCRCTKRMMMKTNVVISESTRQRMR